MGLFNVPRGPSDWGEILFQPKWADKYRTNPERAQLTWVHAGLLILLLGIVIVILMTLLILVETITLMMVLVSAITLAFFIGSAYVVRKEIIEFYTRMPPRIYEKGVTLVKVPFKKGYRREEILVPFDKVVQVRMVDFGHRNFFGGEKKCITLVYRVEDGSERSQEINNWVEDEDDVSPYVRVLHDIDPHLIDDEIAGILDPLSQDLERFDLPSFQPKRLIVGMVWSSLVVTSIIAVFIGFAFVGLGMGPTQLFALSIMYPTLLAVGVLTPYLIEKRRFNSLLITRTKGDRTGLKIDLEEWNPVFLFPIYNIPSASIERIDLHFTFALSIFTNVIVTSGQVIFNPGYVFKEFAELGFYGPVENRLVNRMVSLSSFPVVPRANRKRMIQASLLYLLMILVSGAVSISFI